MSIRIGDAVFLRSGQPAVVKDRLPSSGELILEKDQKAVQQAFRHGYINGMSADTRATLNEILDRIKGETKEPAERIAAMQTKLTELDQDPRNRDLSRYLRSEMMHLMNTYNIKPREFKLDEINVR
ncbi:MAG: hypothetical protein FJ146_11855 [Deltaproteobacteria bacterium]|nr:hypothetical protein [Deltaproteobacteria bacterium]